MKWNAYSDIILYPLTANNPWLEKVHMGSTYGKIIACHIETTSFTTVIRDV